MQDLEKVGHMQLSVLALHLLAAQQCLVPTQGVDCLHHMQHYFMCKADDAAYNMCSMADMQRHSVHVQADVCMVLMHVMFD